MLESFFIEIQKQNERYRLRIRRSEAARPLLESTPEFSPDTVLDGFLLGELCESLLQGNEDFLRETFDERLQLTLGRHLHQQTLGQLPGLPRAIEGDAQVHIITDDEFIARLPWVLLADSGNFLSACGWSISLSRPDRSHQPAEVPPSPRLLVVAPQPAGLDETQAEAHLDTLERLLTPADPYFERGQNLRVVTTWDDFRRAVEDFQPHLLYYYGHGTGNARTSRLVFTDKHNHPLEIPTIDIAHQLRQGTNPPVLAYINACLGDAGGLLGAGWQLGEVIPAVITNRTTAYVDAARRQAEYFWAALLLDGIPPHRAISEMYAHLGNMGLSFADARWMTPVLHRHYNTWKSNPPRPRHRIEDPHWHVKLDRTRQFGQVLLQTQEMLLNRKPPALAYLWYGQEGQGVDLFHERLTVQLREHLPRAHLYEVRPRWPDHLYDPERAFEDTLLEAFKVHHIDDIPARIRGETRGERGRDPVIYVRHEPLRKGEIVKPEHLGTYLNWWDQELLPRLREARAFGLLGLSFVVSNPTAFLKVAHKHRLDAPETRHLVVHLLDELEKLVKKDLLDFLRTHNVVLPQQHRDRVLDEILQQTGGNYDLTLAELRTLVRRAWTERQSEPPEEDLETDPDW